MLVNVKGGSVTGACASRQLCNHSVHVRPWNPLHLHKATAGGGICVSRGRDGVGHGVHILVHADQSVLFIVHSSCVGSSKLKAHFKFGSPSFYGEIMGVCLYYCSISPRYMQS